MTFKPAIWRPIAAVLSVVNLVAVGFAAGAAEPWHATLHAGLTLAFAAWAQRLGRSPAQPAQAAPANRREGLEAELDQLRGELAEAQERLDFTERVLARESAVRRPDAEPPR
jgi:TolA-binding protein